MKKTTFLLLALLLMGTTVAKAQLEQKDFDDKYATELVKAGTAAPDFKMKTPDGKDCQRQDRGARLLGFVVSRLPQGCP